MSRYDRYGERLEDEREDTVQDHPATCDKGWLGEDLDGSLIPCLVCRPHLRDYFARRSHR